MSSFENPSRSVAEKSEAPKDLKEYFQSYVTDAESSEDKEAFVDLDKIKAVLEDIDTEEYTSAREYLDSEITRMQGIEQNMSGFEFEEGKPYLEKITTLRNSLR